MAEFGDGLTPEKREALAKMYGLEGAGTPRYDDLPKAMDPVAKEKMANHKKAVKLIDQLASHTFMRYLPNVCVVNTQLDARAFKEGYSYAATVRTDRELPVNAKITAATGISRIPCERNWYNLLAQKVMLYYEYFGATAVSPCLIFRARGEKTRMGRRYGSQFDIAAMVGVLFKLDIRPPDGSTAADIMKQFGVLHGANQKALHRLNPITLEQQSVLESSLKNYPLKNKDTGSRLIIAP